MLSASLEVWWAIIVGTSITLALIVGFLVVLLTSNRRLREERDFSTSILEAAPALMIVMDGEGKIVRYNRAGERVIGRRPEEVLGRSFREFPRIAEGLCAAIGDCDKLSLDQFPVEFESTWQDENGTERSINWVYSALPDGSGGIRWIIGTGVDITENKRLQQRLYGAQKMEAIGRLAGGVAHDFNNLLTTIMGYTYTLLTSLPEDDSRRYDVLEIDKAANRAANITRQLLAYGRKQIVEPKILSLNDVIQGMDSMLQRLVGEAIELRYDLAPDLRLTRLDPSIVERTVINLVLNSRDAMPEGGTVTIRTRNADLGADYVRRHPQVHPGRYVMLAIEDTGVGMDKATVDRIFEPFFTTKEIGAGTGLGLATVYGMVKQSNGYIWVYSEVGLGTTIKVYFPEASKEETEGNETAETFSPHGSETILLVEDDEEIRQLATKVLTDYGYSVLAASGPEEALDLFAGSRSRIDLVVTDVVMPKMSGRELASRLLKQKEDLTVLYISGYTDDRVVRDAILEPGAHFLEKPFTPEALARAVRKALHETGNSTDQDASRSSPA